MLKRVFLIVLDSFGIGEMPDSYKFNDEGSNTLAAVRTSNKLCADNLIKLGLYNVDGVSGGIDDPIGSYARLTETSAGKDTTVGHWEIAGVISEKPLPTYPDGFPKEVIDEFERLTGRKTICNKPYSGTEVIKDYGRKHMETGDLIVYTSADSVFQIAAHEKIVPVEELYDYCEIARRILTGKHGVGRVIARPFVGEYPDFTRTSNRRDFSIQPPSDTLLDVLQKNGLDTIGVGKIHDIFAGRGLDETYHIDDNNDGMRITGKLLNKDFEGLCFINLVDFDMKYGHRNDIDGYAKAITDFDRWVKGFMANMRSDDIMILTADHGCDPSTPSTDHSREYVFMLAYGEKIKRGVNLGTLPTFADISATVLDIFGVNNTLKGNSFYGKIKAAE